MRHDSAKRQTTACRQGGFALVLALLALLVLAGIASAAVAASVGQVRVATMAGKVLSARSGARGGLDVVFRQKRGVPGTQVGAAAMVLDSGTFGHRGTWRVRELRLAREFHLFIGEGEIGGGVSMRESRVAWWMDPTSRTESHGAVVEAGSLEIGVGSDVRTDSILAIRAGMEGCGELAASPGLALAQHPTAYAMLPSPPEWGSAADADFAGLRLGWFSESMLAELADHELSGGTFAAPGCSGCWRGLVYSRGDLLLTGREAGVLAVRGSLRLQAGANWTGLILASGDVALDQGATIVGLVRAGGSVALGDGSLIDGSACAAYNALREASTLARPIPLPRRSWAGPVPPAAR